MARISGTVSRTIPLDAVIGRPLSLSGTFDLYVTGAEFQRITAVLDALIASNIMTAHTRSIEDGGLIASVSAPTVDVALSGGSALPSPLQVLSFSIPDAATVTYTIPAPKKIEIVDVMVHKVGAGAANTIQIQDASAAAITDAIVAAVDKAKTSAGTIDRTKNVVAAGGSFKIAASRSAGSMQAEVYLFVVLR